MKNKLKKIFLKLGLLPFFYRLSGANAAKNDRKQQTVLDFKKRFAIETFVETGTYLGEMVCAVKGHFSRIYSVELSPELYDRAVKRFRNDRHIKILEGDSGQVLPRILQEIKEPCLFWLDAHYSAGITAKGDTETPAEAELGSILESPFDHIILIDDAKDFNGESGYPKIEALRKIVSDKKPHSRFELADNVVRIYPNR